MGEQGTKIDLTGQRDHSPAPGGNGAAGRASLTYVDGTCVEMLRARTVRKNNASGVPGVEWIACRRRWRATICFKGQRHYLGSYELFEDAVKARKEAESSLFDAFLDEYDGNEPPPKEEARPPKTRDYSDQRLDLAGRQFGRLTVLTPAENIGSMTAWNCRCVCGKETVVMTAHLCSGHTTSCGCKPKGTFADGTFIELLHSKTLRKNNTSGATGVEWLPAVHKWRAVLFFKGKRYYLGHYEHFEDAVNARKQAEKEIIEPFLQGYAKEAAAADD